MTLTDGSSPYAEAPTEWLTHQAVLGDVSARNEIVQRTMPQLMAWFTVQIRASRAFRLDATECVNEVWMRALPRLKSFDPQGGSIRAWLLGIARHILNEHRHRAIRNARGMLDGEVGEQALHTVEDSITRVSEVIARSEQHQILARLLDTLDTEDTLLITWHGLEGRLLGDVAAELGITRDAAAKRWQRLLARLRDRGVDLGLFAPGD